MRSFKEMALNEHVKVEKLYNALNDEKFVDRMYDWFQDNYADAALYAGEDTPDGFIEYLELKGGKKLRDFYMDMKKEGFIK